MPDERRDATPPVLPPGYEAQPFWGFHAPDGRFWYQFHRVYGPPHGRDGRGPVQQLDEQRSYWEVTWPTAVGTIDERLQGRSMSYAKARELKGPDLTFERFSSMRYQLPELLEIADIGSLAAQ